LILGAGLVPALSTSSGVHWMCSYYVGGREHIMTYDWGGVFIGLIIGLVAGVLLGVFVF